MFIRLTEIKISIFVILCKCNGMSSSPFDFLCLHYTGGFMTTTVIFEKFFENFKIKKQTFSKEGFGACAPFSDK